MGLYFEEFETGKTVHTEARTVTDSDVMTFANLTGDNNRIHTDEEFSKAGPFGRRVAHGLLGLSIAVGLAWKTGILDGTVIAFREINDWKFNRPVFLGDVVHADLNVVETKPLPRIGGGSVVLSAELKNEKEEVCMKGNLTLLVISKPK